MEFLTAKLFTLDSEDDKTQIVGMSATLPNPQLLARWLKAKFYIAKYRPISIEEHLVYDNSIYPTPRPHPQRKIETSVHQELSNDMTNAVVALAVETAMARHGALLFCCSRSGTERMPATISDDSPTEHLSPEDLDRRHDLLASLRALPGGFEPTFIETILSASGFTMQD
jgi:replicative superfamily II helicase